MIKVQNLYKKYGNIDILQGISTEIAAGECVAIIGASGVGKTVFLRSLAMLEKPDKGNIWIDGQEITDPKCNLNKIREKMGMVYQGFHLFSHLNVIDNISLAPQVVLGLSKEAAERKAQDLLEMVGMPSKARAMPQELSGGQSQRVAIARTLAMNPKIILFDEPTSALDPTMVGEVLAIMRKLRSQEITMMIVTHEMNFVQEVASRVFYMDEGKIYEEGTAEEIFKYPQGIKTIQFIKKLKQLEYDLSSQQFDLIELFSRVEHFCVKYGLNRSKIFTTQLILEECLTALLSESNHAPILPLKCIVEYGAADSSLSISILYRGPTENIIETRMDEIQKMIIRGKSKDHSHSYHNGVNDIKIIL